MIDQKLTRVPMSQDDREWAEDRRWANGELDEGSMKTRAVAVIGLLTLLLVIGLWCGTSNAQTTCTAGGTTNCFTASKTSGAFPIATTLTWNAVGATSCTAGGVGAWSGSVPTSGVRNLTGINVDMHLTLTCAIPSSAKVDWLAPTTNTDGAPITGLAGYRVLYGASATALTQTIDVPNAAALTYTVTNLTAGTWFFGVKAYNSSAVESAVSNVASKAIAAGQYSAFVDIDGTAPAPSAPTGLTVTDVTAYEIYKNSSGVLLAHEVGEVPPGTVCASEGQQTVGTAVYSRVDRGLLDKTAKSTNAADRWVSVLYAKCAS